MTAFQARTINTSDVRLSACARGVGERMPALLLHADLGDCGQWSEIADHLARSRRVVSFDRRGHGESSQPRNGFGYSREVDDVAAVRAAFDLDRVIVIGHSGGGAVGYLFAQRYPESVAGLLLVDPPQSREAMPEGQMAGILERSRADPTGFAKSFYQTIAGDDPAVVDRVLSDVEATPAATVMGMITALAEFDPAVVERSFSGPAEVVLQSKNDTKFGLPEIAGFPRRTIDGAGHWIAQAATARFLSLLDGFLASVDEHETSCAIA
jgi:pimeloyl-ACP methyl ester carboxylesterase